MAICIDYPSADKVRFVALEVDRGQEKLPYIYAVKRAVLAEFSEEREAA